jgi:predicted ribosome quality control (RQC) complex YloA/Tae2 family protein
MKPPPTLGARHVRELVEELAPLVVGASVVEVLALPPRDVLLYFKDLPSGDARAVARVRVSADADAPRLHLQRSRQSHPDGPVGPFFRRLSSDLVGARLRKLTQVARDRIVAFEFESTPCGERRVLLAELTGRHANLLLLGPNERLLEVLATPAPGSKAAERLRVGEPWKEPAGKPREDEGLGLSELLEAPQAPGDELDGAAEAPSEPGAARPDPNAPLSWLVETRLGPAVQRASRERAVRDLRERVSRKHERARALLAGLRQRLAAVDNSERVLWDGELLKASLGQLKRGQSSIVLADHYAADGAPRTIELDPRRSPHENVEQYFERYKKLVRSAESVAREIELAEQKVSAYETALAQLAAEGSDLGALEQAWVGSGLLDKPQTPPSRKSAPEPRKPYHSFAGLHGGEILVGRNARDNDELSTRICRGNDMWFHTADAPGSHVVLRLAGRPEADPEDVLDAAHLAVHFSPLRGATRANVHVARGKDVHKPRGAKPGLVTLSGGKTLSLRLQPERLQRLLGER